MQMSSCHTDVSSSLEKSQELFKKQKKMAVVGVIVSSYFKRDKVVSS